ncbi:hypothetical protein [Actinoplanes xinjiangensis]
MHDRPGGRLDGADRRDRARGDPEVVDAAWIVAGISAPLPPVIRCVASA